MAKSQSAQFQSVDAVPAWVRRRVPANAVRDEELEANIQRLCEGLPATITELTHALDAVAVYVEYDTAANLACAGVWSALESFYRDQGGESRLGLFRFVVGHMHGRARTRLIRRLAKDPDFRVRRVVQRFLRVSPINEVALPTGDDGDWNTSGWSHDLRNRPLNRHRQGSRVMRQRGLPVVSTVAELRELLGIKSTKQLGYFLLATSANDGPYVSFTIPKRDGGEREICAPKGQLRWVQHQIYTKILSQVPVHDAAHGFIAGRSTVTNAEPHRGASMLLKFDLSDFFPTIHYFRVQGLFASLGYAVGDGRFSNDDASSRIAPTLARLCVYAADATRFGAGRVPQGAPTSPAISNLVCRGLDARLDGLAVRMGGVYTRYADDLTFSFRDNALNVGRFRWWVDQICHQEGFFVNQKKFRLIRGSQRQTVTGIVVNDELRVPRRQRRRFRAILHNCRAHGVASQARGRANFKGYLRGFASYIHMVHPTEGRELLKEVADLLGDDPRTDEPTRGSDQR